MAHRSALWWLGYWLACRVGTDRACKDSVAYRISSRTNVTGPSKPEGSSGEFAL